MHTLAINDRTTPNKLKLKNTKDQIVYYSSGEITAR